MPRPSRPAPVVEPESRVRAARAGARVHLTRRGRRVLALGLIVAALAAFTLGRLTSGAEAAAPRRTVTAAPGDTLWAIASRLAPQADPRDEVERIVAVNHLAGSAVNAGQVLVVP